MRRWFSCAALALTLFSTTGQAGAAEASIDWRWRRFQTWEYAATAASLAGGFYLRFGVDSPGGDWQGGVVFDDWLRERTAIDDIGTRRAMVTVTDALYFGAMGYRLVDSVFVPGVVWGSWDTALQMSMIDLEAFGFVAITLWSSQALFGRERPYVSRCPDFEGETCDPDDPERNRSFYAGHPAVAMTSAGLTCTHHAYLPLYGGGAADTLACGVMIGAAATTGFGRMVTEKHYASDVLIGMGIGAFAGFGLPRLLHYGEPRAQRTIARERRAPLTVRATALPMIAEDRLGLAVGGSF